MPSRASAQAPLTIKRCGAKTTPHAQVAMLLPIRWCRLVEKVVDNIYPQPVEKVVDKVFGKIFSDTSHLRTHPALHRYRVS